MRNTLIFIAISGLICQFSYAQAQKSLPGATARATKGPPLTPEQVIDTLSKIIANPKTNKSSLGIIYYFRAENYKTARQFDKAYQDYTKSIELGPGAGYIKNATWNRGLSSEALNKLPDAIRDFQTVLFSYPKTDSIDKSTLYSNIAFDQYRLQKADSAALNDSLAIGYSSMNSRAYYLRAMMNMMKKNYQSAVNDLTRAIEVNRDFSNTVQLSLWYSFLADAKAHLKEYKEAINNYSFALKLNPDNRLAYWNRAAAYYQHRDYELATNDYSKAITYYSGQKTELSKLYDDRAVNEEGQNLLDKAIQDDSLAITLDANNKRAYFNLGNIYSQNADYQKGIDLFKTSLTFQKDNNKLNSFLYYQIANDEYFLNEYDKVIEDCTTSISLNPDYGSAYFYRGKVYFKKFNKKDLALADFNKVIAMDTTHKSVDYVFSLFFVGRGDEALDILQKDVLNTTDEALLLQDYYNLACLYSMMNKPDEANNYLKMAIDKGYSKKYAMTDEDLDNIRNTAEYKATIGYDK